MKRTGIFYGSTTGTTGMVANKIAETLGIPLSDVHDVAKTAASAVGDYDALIIGASTWGFGDLQADMADFLDGIAALDLRGKECAVFGCGDDSMSDTFCNSVGEIYHRLHDTGVEFIAPFKNDGYEYGHTQADVSGLIVGLCIDEVNHPDLTDGRIKAWCDEIKEEIS